MDYRSRIHTSCPEAIGTGGEFPGGRDAGKLVKMRSLRPFQGRIEFCCAFPGVSLRSTPGYRAVMPSALANAG